MNTLMGSHFISFLIMIFTVSLNHRIMSNSFATKNNYALTSLKHKRSKISMEIINSSPLLNDKTLWRIRMRLEKVGFKSIEAIARIRFIPDRGYEPPQGRIFVEDDFYGIIRVDDKGYSGSWTLSEDKNDRKDGLWIWGLFEEPKYPYLYFSFGEIYSFMLCRYYIQSECYIYIQYNLEFTYIYDNILCCRSF